MAVTDRGLWPAEARSVGVVLNIDRTETEVAACVCDSSLSSPHSSFRSPAMLARRSMSRSTRSPPFSSRPAQLFNWETGQAKLPHSFTQNTTLWGLGRGWAGGGGGSRLTQLLVEEV